MNETVLSKRISGYLNRWEITPEELAQMTDLEILDIRGIGWRSLVQIRKEVPHPVLPDKCPTCEAPTQKQLMSVMRKGRFCQDKWHSQDPLCLCEVTW